LQQSHRGTGPRLLERVSRVVTADVYARHLPTGDKAILDRLERQAVMLLWPSRSRT
jgi:hypothetical protein